MRNDFTLSPDDDPLDRPERRRPLRVVSSGLAPTAPLPKARGKDTPPAYSPCLLCGCAVLTGTTLEGHTLPLDVQTPCYCVVWEQKAPMPTLVPSRAYPVHHWAQETTSLPHATRDTPCVGRL